jgi:hypothetical protein
VQLFFPLRFAFALFNGFFARFTVRRKGTAVDDSERFFWLMVVLLIGQGGNPREV